MKLIKLTTITGKEIMLPAVVKGNIAIHQQTDNNGYVVKDEYTVSHSISGLSVAYGIPMRAAIRLADELRALGDWQATSLEELKALPYYRDAHALSIEARRERYSCA